MSDPIAVSTRVTYSTPAHIQAGRSKSGHTQTLFAAERQASELYVFPVHVLQAAQLSQSDQWRTRRLSPPQYDLLVCPCCEQHGQCGMPAAVQHAEPVSD